MEIWFHRLIQTVNLFCLWLSVWSFSHLRPLFSKSWLWRSGHCGLAAVPVMFRMSQRWACGMWWLPVVSAPLVREAVCPGLVLWSRWRACAPASLCPHTSGEVSCCELGAVGKKRRELCDAADGVRQKGDADQMLQGSEGWDMQNAQAGVVTEQSRMGQEVRTASRLPDCGGPQIQRRVWTGSMVRRLARGLPQAILILPISFFFSCWWLIGNTWVAVQ